MISILSSKLVGDKTLMCWACLLEIEREGQAWHLPASAPGGLSESELQAHFDGQEDELWAVAERKGYEPDVVEYLPERLLLRRLLRLLLDELNILRELHGLAPRTIKQLKDQLRLDK